MDLLYVRAFSLSRVWTLGLVSHGSVTGELRGQIPDFGGKKWVVRGNDTISYPEI